jgi:hypothetical protein
VRRGAIARRAIGNGVGLALGGFNELLDVGKGCIGIGRDHHRHAADQRNSHQVFLGVKGLRLVQRHVGRQRIGRHHQGVAVGLGGDDRLDRDVGARARLVLDHKGLAQAGLQALPNGSRHHVHRATGGITHHNLHGLAGVVLGQRRDAKAQRAEPECEVLSNLHVQSPAD